MIASCGWKFGRWLDIVLMEKSATGLGDSCAPELQALPHEKQNLGRLAGLSRQPGGCTVSICMAWATETGWLLPIPSAGPLQIERVFEYGQDDTLSWLLIALGFTIAGCAQAILFGLATPEKWNARYNPQATPDAAARAHRVMTIGASPRRRWWEQRC